MPRTETNPPAQARRHRVLYRHPLAVRLTHWTNVLCIAALLPSGLQISNAHPALYLGAASAFAHPLVALPTFPDGATLPDFRDLALGRRWHFFFAWLFAGNLVLMLGYGLASGRYRTMLAPSFADLRGIGRDIVDHLRLRFAQDAGGYNVLQKLAYLGVVGLLAPLMLLTGLCLSPGLDAVFPWLPGLLGGRQTARTIHFISAAGIALYVAVHLAMVVASGPINNLRAIITGRYHLREDADARGPA
ncbi:cytochrome b/b6 domain-containing protein [Caulobacter sp. KR2-114]|uniref:cytochrome b/b6 domain-containing protein n=1 Tax=Caulobacter sp. KR2-114 TaxID=3400912 RepID=UPI003C000CAF